MKKADLLLHPVRMRIIQSLLGDRELTTADLHAELPDIPAATLYRQIATLLDGGAIEVINQRKVRGTFERTYALVKENLSLSAEEAGAMTPDEHAEAFLNFMTARLSDYERYLSSGSPDLLRDLVGYRVNAMYLSDEEAGALLTKLSEAVLPFTENTPGPGRRRRIFSTIFLPADEA